MLQCNLRCEVSTPVVCCLPPPALLCDGSSAWRAGKAEKRVQFSYLAHMNNKTILQKTQDFIKDRMSGEGSGHDWFHVERVVKNALHIGQTEKGSDMFLVELGALLHDIADSKFYPEGTDEKEVRKWLESLAVEQNIIDSVVHIVQAVSFKGGKNPITPATLEAKIVQDADRLDALGAIGIARAFAYGGFKGRLLYDPEVKPIDFSAEGDYKKHETHTINHFYEKLLKLKDLMNTKTGRQLAAKREQFIKEYLKHFYAEWEGRE
jgi:uncharacterized protein